MMSNAHGVFTHFASMLKCNKKADCTYTDPMIDEVCSDFARLSVLWDGAFSLASKVNPEVKDIEMFKRFVRAAFFRHKAMKISITHKDHIMWMHVANAMRLPGGLGKKKEDWLEKQHQEGSEIRVQYRTTQNQETRAKAIAGATHRYLDPQVIARIKEVNNKSEHGERLEYTKKEEERRLEREQNRMKALESWEGINTHTIMATRMALCHPILDPWPDLALEANLPPVGDAKVVTWVSN